MLSEDQQVISVITGYGYKFWSDVSGKYMQKATINGYYFQNYIVLSNTTCSLVCVKAAFLIERQLCN